MSAGRAWAIVALAVASVIARGLFGADQFGFSGDEVHSVALTRDWAEMWRALRGSEANMWLYYALLGLWPLGDGEVAVRSLSVLCAAATLPAIYALGARLFGRPAGVTAALVLSANAFFVRHAIEARGYALAGLLATVATFTLVRAIERPTRGRVALHAITAVLAVHAHFFAAATLLAHAVALAFVPREHRPPARLLEGVVLVGALLAATLAMQPLHGAQIDWIPPFTAGAIEDAGARLAGNTAPAWISYLIAALVAAWRWPASAARDETPPWLPRFAGVLVLACVFVPPVAAVLVSVLVRPVFVARYLIVALPPLMLWIACGLVSLKPRLLAGAALVLVFGASAHALLEMRFETEDWRGAAARLAREGRPDDAVIVYAYHMRGALEHYLDRQTDPRSALPELVDVASAPYPEIGGTRLPEPDLDRIAALQHPRVWLVLSHDYLSALGRDRQSAAITAALSRRYQLEDARIERDPRVLRYRRRAP